MFHLQRLFATHFFLKSEIWDVCTVGKYENYKTKHRKLVIVSDQKKLTNN